MRSGDAGRSASLTLLLLLIHAAQLSAQFLNGQQIAARSAPAMVSILPIGPAGDTLSRGSGFVLRADGMIVTNWHVLANAHSAVVILSNQQRVESAVFVDGDSIADLALIRIPAAGLPVLPASFAVPQVGNRLVVLNRLRDGATTASESGATGLTLVNGRQVIRLSAEVSSESSGGPVLDGAGRVIGVAVGRVVQGKSVNAAVAISDVLTLLSSNATPRQLNAVFAPRPNTSIPSPARSSRSAVVPAGLGQTYSFTARLFSSGHIGVGPATVQPGSLLLTSTGQGLIAFQGNNANVLWVYGARTSADGTTHFNAGKVAFQGQLALTGLRVTAVDSGSMVAIEIIAQTREYPPTDRSGLYEVQTRTGQSARGVQSRDSTSWTGSVAVIVAGARLHMLLQLQSANGVTSGALIQTSIGRDGTFQYKSETAELSGTLDAGRLNGHWVDLSIPNVRRAGSITGRLSPPTESQRQ